MCYSQLLRVEVVLRRLGSGVASAPAVRLFFHFIFILLFSPRTAAPAHSGLTLTSRTTHLLQRHRTPARKGREEVGCAVKDPRVGLPCEHFTPCRLALARLVTLNPGLASGFIVIVEDAPQIVARKAGTNRHGRPRALGRQPP